MSLDPLAYNHETGEFMGITPADRRQWQAAYPAVDIDTALAQMCIWLQTNKAKAHKKEWRRFVTTWFKKEQERSGGAAKRTTVTICDEFEEPAAQTGKTPRQIALERIERQKRGVQQG